MAWNSPEPGGEFEISVNGEVLEATTDERSYTIEAPAGGTVYFTILRVGADDCSTSGSATLSTGEANFSSYTVRRKCLHCDRDNDGINDDEDNCPGIANPNQEDENGDNIGDDCDGVEDPKSLIGDDGLDYDYNCDGETDDSDTQEDFEVIAEGLTESHYTDSECVINYCEYIYTVSAVNSCGNESDASDEISVTPYFPGVGPFIRGDSNGDGTINISDPSATLNWLFLGGGDPPCLSSTDANKDGSINISDPTYTLRFLFLGGAAHPIPISCKYSADIGDVNLGCETETCEYE